MFLSPNSISSMAAFSSSLRSTFTNLPLFSIKPCPKPRRPSATFTPVRCGPRSNRGPLMKGRILSTEAIHAIQSLKRAYRTSKQPNLPNLTRLLKPDLVSVLRELLRQDLCHIALSVFSVLRSEFPDHKADLNLYGDAIFALVKNRMIDEIESLVAELEAAAEEGKVEWERDTGTVRVVKGVVEAGRKESTVRMVKMLRRSGCGDTWSADEYAIKYLSKGLRNVGEDELAAEIEVEFGRVCQSGLK
ncbi:Protein THYLAKOID ASSEMBLY 8, chloroplastic [Linum grandiflorum]